MAGLFFLAAAAVVDDRAAGRDHYFNLEYNEAVAAYERVLQAEPDDPTIYNHLATAILYKELNRLGMLETSAFKGDNRFLERKRPKPDPSVKDKIFGYLDRGRLLAGKRLKTDPADRSALFALSHNYALRANYRFMVDKAYFQALRNGRRARKFSNSLRKHHPEFVDADLVSGVQEYVIGSLPWPVRAVIAIGGARGNKVRGEAMLARVAREGSRVRDEARSLMALVHRREGRPLEAASMLASLLRDYPRNYVLQLEMAAMYLDAGDEAQALVVFKDVQRKYEADEQRFARMPPRLARALERRIEELETSWIRPARNSPRCAVRFSRAAPRSVLALHAPLPVLRRSREPGNRSTCPRLPPSPARAPPRRRDCAALRVSSR